jgi:hypothetical protein
VAQGSQFGAAIGLITFGVLLTIVGTAVWSSCSAQPTINGIAPSCGGLLVAAVVGVVFLVVGIALAAMAAATKPRTIYPATDPAVPPPLIQPVVVQQTVVQQTVEVRCPFCGRLNPVTATTCAGCGAAL